MGSCWANGGQARRVCRLPLFSKKYYTGKSPGPVGKGFKIVMEALNNPADNRRPRCRIGTGAVDPRTFISDPCLRTGREGFSRCALDASRYGNSNRSCPGPRL